MGLGQAANPKTQLLRLLIYLHIVHGINTGAMPQYKIFILAFVFLYYLSLFLNGGSWCSHWYIKTLATDNQKQES